ncbi:MAG: RNA polymerase subunit sigma-70 [Acidobacteriota bacterium]|nr:RNA polymerase subunit sigma-70 [Acidobacteriota bacterium]
MPADRETADRITGWLQQWREGDEAILPRLTAQIYGELRRLAGSVMKGESKGNTIQPTALVHELYMRLPGVQHIDWQSRAQFLNIAAAMMRHILVDRARKRHALKRGGPARIAEWKTEPFAPGVDADVLAVHEALERFAVDYPRQARVVELRFFGGLTLEETADVMTATGAAVSRRTVDRDWTFARAWLRRELNTGGEDQ